MAADLGDSSTLLSHMAQQSYKISNFRVPVRFIRSITELLIVVQIACKPYPRIRLKNRNERRPSITWLPCCVDRSPPNRFRNPWLSRKYWSRHLVLFDINSFFQEINTVCLIDAHQGLNTTTVFITIHLCCLAPFSEDRQPSEIINFKHKLPTRLHQHLCQ